MMYNSLKITEQTRVSQPKQITLAYLPHPAVPGVFWQNTIALWVNTPQVDLLAL